jgi:hypothetical protein
MSDEKRSVLERRGKQRSRRRRQLRTATDAVPTHVAVDVLSYRIRSAADDRAGERHLAATPVHRFVVALVP